VAGFENDITSPAFFQQGLSAPQSASTTLAQLALYNSSGLWLCFFGGDYGAINVSNWQPSSSMANVAPISFSEYGCSILGTYKYFLSLTQTPMCSGIQYLLTLLN